MGVNKEKSMTAQLRTREKSQIDDYREAILKEAMKEEGLIGSGEYYNPAREALADNARSAANLLGTKHGEGLYYGHEDDLQTIKNIGGSAWPSAEKYDAVLQGERPSGITDAQWKQYQGAVQSITKSGYSTLEIAASINYLLNLRVKLGI